ncbi:3784_t:CDS:10 [Funneliformis caledonium]|uniref:3784_t:CDS:1 n=1 Tax=Funneliformis caledonium TaxID=1117310 RepID=A0A9N8VYT4_9GLOM|nr:3784_t:CDS:10 [Funneliformis caledonium]
MLSIKKRNQLELDLSLEKLPYEIHSYSSYTAFYYPRNIMENKPLEQSSRWSSSCGDELQYIIIKLESMAIVRILSSLIRQRHVCNLKKFKVYGGLTPNNMIELLSSGLRNDEIPETFRLKHQANNVILPCQYIKIVPLVAYAPNFNFSIWYIELKGIRDQEVVQKVYYDFITYRENEAIRLCLKHFRQRNYLDAFNSLQSRTNLLLEDPFLTELYTQLVMNGDFQVVEERVSNALEKGLFEEYIRSHAYKHQWTKIDATNIDGDSPCMRGGHQMCIDVEAGCIYLLGGWNGADNLSDFWVYNVNTKIWTLISSDTKVQGGPGPRSNHKICLDPDNKQIYVLGRFIGRDMRANANYDSDFYRYDIICNEWEQLSENTLLDGGPVLIYDHQMCIDSEKQILYVFGGRTVHPDAEQFYYSGLFSYNIASKKWKLIRSDGNDINDRIQFKSRIGHSMLLDPNEKLLYIIGGERDNKFLSDFYIYDINADSIYDLPADYAAQDDQDEVSMQRTTFDINTRELFVLAGLKDKKDKRDKKATLVRNSFWVYDLKMGKWTKLYQSENFDPYKTSDETLEPRPRYAYQMVYDSENKVQYLFGGRTVETEVSKQRRLDDFWKLQLVRPKSGDLLRQIKFLIRKQKFREMCLEGDSIKALKYLQVQLAQVVDHTNEKESSEFYGLSTSLILGDETNDTFNERTKLYEKLLEFFPEEMKQPKGNLIDLINIE